MARLGFSNFAANDPSSGGNIDGLNTATRETSIIRNGFSSAKCNSGAGNSSIQASVPGTPIGLGAGTNSSSVQFVRGYFYFSNLPGTTIGILQVSTFSGGGTTIKRIGVDLDSTGHLIARTGDNTSSASVSTLSVGTWYRIECKVTLQTTSAPTAIATVNAVFLDGQNLSLTATLTETLVGTGFSSVTPKLGWITAPGANLVCYVSDVAWNDDQGVNQNSYPGSGKVALLLPTATNGSPAAKWTDNDGTQTNMWEGVNNTPPTGTAATTTPSHLYIKHAGGAAGTTDEFDATMTTYSAAGVGVTDTVSVIQYYVVVGEESATGTKLLAIKGVSNPVVSQSSSFDVAPVSGAQGTYPSNWLLKRDALAMQYNPSVTIASAPVFGVVRPETASRVASVCAMYMYVDYVPASTPVVGSESDAIPAKSSQIVSVNRASFY